MMGKVGYKSWSRGRQVGLRVYADTIRSLRHKLRFPSQDEAFSDLDQWMCELESGAQPARYSRPVVVMLPDKQIHQCTLTISTLPPKSLQGYVTAPAGSAFANLVAKESGKNIEADFQPSLNVDTIILHPPSTDDEIHRRRRYAVRNLRKLSRPATVDLVEQGMYFECLEYERRMAELSDDLVIDWRAPSIHSNSTMLREHDISCDIDVLLPSGTPQLCIEVKSLSGSPNGTFVLTRREFESRKKCVALGIEYEIVIYGFANTGIEHRSAGADIRKVIKLSEPLKCETKDYVCW